MDKYTLKKYQDIPKKEQDLTKKENIVINMYPTLIFPDSFSLGTLLPDDEFYNLLYPPLLVRPRHITQSFFLHSRL